MAKSRFLTREEIRDVYQKRAGTYELAIRLYYLLGSPVGRYRRLGVEALAPWPGDTIIEIGCGTGINFPLLQEKIGPDGKIIGVDLSEAMLEQAEKRINAAGWRNVELVHSSAADYAFPDRVDGIIATGVLNYEPDYDEVVQRGAKSLAPGKRWAVFDYKMPSGWFRHLVPFFVWVSQSFGISQALFERAPLESIKRHLHHVKIQEFYFGLIFIASGEAPTPAAPR